MDIIAYGLSKKYTDDTADSLGSLKGAPCTIKSVDAIPGGKRVTYEWTGTSGTKQTSTMDVMDGAKGDPGDDGYSPAITVTEIAGGNRVTITDEAHPTGQSFDVMNGQGGLSEDAKTALLQIESKVAYIDADGQGYYDALYNALYPSADLASISCVYTQSGTVYDTDSLDSLKADLVVTAHYDDQTTAIITSYTLSGTLTVGTSTITVSYGGKTTTFNVTVSEGSSTNNVSYEVGTISSSTGEETDSTSRLRTDYIPVNKNDLVVVGTGLQFIARVYDENKSFVGSVPNSGWRSNYSVSVTTSGYIRLVLRHSDDSTVVSGELDGDTFAVQNKVYYFDKPAFPVQNLYVYDGKGVSGTSIVDNANRALSGEIQISEIAVPIFHERVTTNSDTNIAGSLKFIYSNGDVETNISTYISPGMQGSFGLPGNRYGLLSTKTNNYTPFQIPQNTAKARILFANDNNTSAPLPSLPTGIFCIGKRRYKLVEGTDFT